MSGTSKSGNGENMQPSEHVSTHINCRKNLITDKLSIV